MKSQAETQRIVLDCLAEAVFGVSAVLPEALAWEAVFEEAGNQSVLPLVFSAARPHLPVDDFPEWDRAAHQILGANVRSEYEHMELHELMTAHAIPYVVLKGAASARYYPEPALRTMGDVDFLIGESDIPEAGELLKRAGFTLEADDGGAHIACVRQNAGALPSVWEMHRAPVGIPDSPAGERIRQFFLDLLETAETVEVPDGRYRVPDRFHHGLILLLHTAAHLTSEGVGLRHLCDWAVFAAGVPDEAFARLFEAPLREIGLWRFAQILTLCSVRYLHCPERAWAGTAEEPLLAALMADILSAGNFGQKDADRASQIKFISNRGEGTVDGKSPLRQMLHTLRRKTRAECGFAARHPALLPVGYAVTGARYLGMVMAGKRKADTVRTLEAAGERKEIYRQLRLFESETGGVT